MRRNGSKDGDVEPEPLITRDGFITSQWIVGAAYTKDKVLGL
jgi:hypothetical protein